MLLRHLKIATLFAVATLCCNPAEACWLTDWLYGRSASPYAVGYAPYAASYTPYSAGYAPYSASYSPYSEGYAPVSAPTAPFANATALPLSSPVATSGAYQVQRPSYLENPSVYMGSPVGTNLQTAYRVPLTTPQLFRSNPSLLGAGSTSSYLGASNVYPRYASGYGGVYSANYPTATPAITMSAAPVSPLFPNAPRPVYRGGLARFFGSLFGTNYRTSYYRAPVTYYRPATSVDPLTGTTVTIQQPCASTIQQLQRTPYNSFQLRQPSITPIGGLTPAGSCNAPASAYGYAPLSGVSQATAMVAPQTAPGQFTVPIPSTNYSPSGHAPSVNPNLGPLTGNPAAPQIQSDLSPVDQPSLGRQPSRSDYGASRYSQPEPQYQYRSRRLDDREESRRSDPRQSEPQQEYREPQSQPTRESSSLPSYWDLQDADDSTAMLPKHQDRRTPSFVRNNHPIRAIDHEDERSPFRSDLMRRDTDHREQTAPFTAPPLPSRTDWPADSANASHPRRHVHQAAAWVPVREASSKRQTLRDSGSRTWQPRQSPSRDNHPRGDRSRDNQWTPVQ